MVSWTLSSGSLENIGVETSKSVQQPVQRRTTVSVLLNGTLRRWFIGTESVFRDQGFERICLRDHNDPPMLWRYLYEV